MEKIHRLRCEYNQNPIGVQTTQPRFSWELESSKRGLRQTAYQIIVSDNERDALAGIGTLWDSKKVDSAETFHIAYAGKPLVSWQRCYWTVRCWDQDGELYEAEEAAFFEMGILSPEEWIAQWIGADETIASPLFRTSFHIHKAVKQASLSVSGLGYFELYMNGERVGDHVLVPNWTDYDERQIEGLLYPFDDQTSKRVNYLQYAVTNNILQGENAIGVMLGNGFYNQTERTIEGKMRYGAPKLIVQIVLTYEDGTVDYIRSDESWKCSSGPIVFNNVFYGEIYDARLEQPGWNDRGFDDSSWEQARLVRSPKGQLTAQTSPPDKKISTLAPIPSADPKSNTYIFDFGQNFSGWVRIRMQGNAGQQVTLKFAENLSADGALDTLNCGGDSQVQKDTYIMKGQGIEQYEPRFVWHGFRYVEVTGYPGVPELTDLEGIVVHTSVESAGHFSCSEPLLNQMQNAYRWSQLTNMHGGVPSDCPHRERLGYTGDGHLTAEAAGYNFDMAAFYTKWIEDISDSQNKQTGFVPHTAPFNGGGGGVAWGSAYIIMPWMMYRTYGDQRLLAEHYEGMKSWIGYLSTRNRGGYLVEYEEEGSWFLGDWCIPGQNDLPPQLVSTFYYAFTVNIMSRIAGVLGYEKDREQYAELYDRICQTFNEAFFNAETATYSIGRQGADLFPLVLGCVPEGYEDQVWERVLKHYREDLNGHLDTGIFGTSFLFDLLSDRGETDLALGMVTTRDYPGYGYMIANGATTLWESWDGHDSHNHPMFGSVSAWFYKHLAGLAPHPDTVAFGQAVFRPFRAEGLSHASASVHTIRGQYAARWSTESSGSWECEIRIPPNCTAEVHFPLQSRNSLILSIFEQGCNQTIWPSSDLEQAAKSLRVKKETNDLVVVLGSGHYEFQVTVKPE
ncbi:glycoside hydrolase family 78 protein [Paenibacillus glycanilyticus]|uniref:alpha-L-rhamnosidase n=1 Tax=Paenibacillus glycanilyticus TaxID=126569 RepID=UPI00203F8FA3|nr:alpha-L-rhamnosidase [Paenibacillus glycanilyticus]MCM3630234.1 glycoside hydrolase family 78 protein [Paenibacillus glycanilyticus]